MGSAVVLAGGPSKRMPVFKALVRLAGKHMIEWILEAVEPVVEEVVVVAKGRSYAEELRKLLGSRASVVCDALERPRAPIVGALSGALEASGEYMLLLPCDQPLLSTETLRRILELCKGHDALVPRWPNGYIEPLTAGYRRVAFIEAASSSIRRGELRMRAPLLRLGDVVYVDVGELARRPVLEFLNVNTYEDLRRAEELIRRGRRS